MDAILQIYLNVTDGLKVYPKVIEKHIREELPFMATENIMMGAVKKGGDRQVLHEQIRIHSVAAGRVVKEEGLPNDLVDRIAADPLFGLTKEQILEHMDPAAYVGRAPEQVTEFIENVINPIRQQYADLLDSTQADLSV